MNYPCPNQIKFLPSASSLNLDFLHIHDPTLFGKTLLLIIISELPLSQLSPHGHPMGQWQLLDCGACPDYTDKEDVNMINNIEIYLI